MATCSTPSNISLILTGSALVNLKTEYLIGPVRRQRVFAVLEHLCGLDLVETALHLGDRQVQRLGPAPASSRKRQLAMAALDVKAVQFETLRRNVVALNQEDRFGERRARGRRRSGHGERGIVFLAFLLGLERLG